jgi:ribonuclease-3
MTDQTKRVMDALGYTFHDEALLRRALTHPSAGKEDNQRLEFLGDAVLQYLMSDRLYRNHPSDREGSLTHMRALLVCEAALSPIAQKLGIGEALVMDRGEEMTGGRTKPSVLCDAMEAVLAAVCLDGGMDAARAVVERCWPAESEVSRPMQDSKGRLQEILQQNGGETPSYRITGTSGPPHAPVFEAAVFRGDREIGRGTGKTKKQAEQAAAVAALKGLGEAVGNETNSDKR